MWRAWALSLFVGMRLLLGLVAFTVTAACRPPTQVTLELTTDADCDALEETSITIGRLGEVEDRDPVTVTSQCSDHTIGSLVTVPAGDDDAEVAFKIVTTIDGTEATTCADDISNCIVARRALRFLANTPLRVPVVMREQCVGVLCPADETCVAGVCTPALIDPGDCTGVGCGEDTLAPAGGGGAWVLRLADGDNNAVRGMAVAASGNVYLVGEFSGALAIGGLSSAVTTAFVASFTPAGQVRWVHGLTSQTQSQALSVALDEAENVYVAGRFLDDIDLGGGASNLVASSGDNALVASYGPEGDYRWATHVPGDSPRAATAVAAGSGKVFAVGYFEGTLGELTAPQEARNAFIMRLTASNGEVEQTTQTYGDGVHALNALALHGSTLLAVGGHSGAFGVLEEVTSEALGALTGVQLTWEDPTQLTFVTGNFQQFGGETSVTLTRLAAAGDTVCTAAQFVGPFEPSGGELVTALQPASAATCRVGAEYWSETLTGKGSVTPTALELTKDGQQLYFGANRTGSVETLALSPVLGGSAFLVATMTRDGGITKITNFDGPGEDRLHAHALDRNDGSFLMAGHGGGLTLGEGVTLDSGTGLFLARVSELRDDGP